MKAAYITLGCKVNQYDTAAMRELMEAAGYSTAAEHERADVVIINTCTVTNVADRKSRQMISRAHHENPGCAVIVCGCLAQRDASDILALPGVCAAVGTKHRKDIAGIASRALAGERNIEMISDDGSFEPVSISASPERIRAHIKIEDGCENFCAYCIIPYARGPVRSRPMADIISEAKALCDSGVKELVLTGIHICSYGKETGQSSLIDVIEQVCALPARVRLGSIEPSMIDEAFIRRAAALPNLCPQFHLSLQSGCDSVLARMNRRYDTRRYTEVTELLRKYFDTPAITTDIIAGFPAETEAEHQGTLRFIADIRFARVHTFVYSEREGTPAALMPGSVPHDIRKRRAAEITAAADKTASDYIDSQIGSTQTVLLETPSSAGMYHGYTEKYIRIEAAGAPGELIRVKLEREKQRLTGAAL